MSHIVSVLKVMGSKKSFPSKTHKNSTHRAPMAGKAGKFGPCLDFGFQYALIRNNWSKNAKKHVYIICEGSPIFMSF